MVNLMRGDMMLMSLANHRYLAAGFPRLGLIEVVQAVGHFQVQSAEPEAGRLIRTLGPPENLHDPCVHFRAIELPGRPDIERQAVGGQRIEVAQQVLFDRTELGDHLLQQRVVLILPARIQAHA